MPIVLLRVDERLIHGQVVLGWGRHLRPDRYVVVDDPLAESEWEQDLYRLALDTGAGAEFETVESARDRLAAWEEGPERTVLLTRDLDHMLRLARGRSLAGRVVNLGGLHHRPGRRQVTSYLHLDDRDRAALEGLRAEGVEVEGRDLPDAPVVPAQRLLH